MKRWRRPLLLIALLLAGAVVNVGVAWVLVGAPNSWTPGGPREVFGARSGGGSAEYVRVFPSSPPLTPDQLRSIRARVRVPTDWGAAEDASIERGAGWTAIYVWRMIGEPGDWDAYRIEGGWPARSMSFGVARPPLEPRYRYTLSLEPPWRLLPGARWFEDGRDRIPLTPIPAGFALNTLFYAAILALPLSVFPIRRRLRARRGRCPKCGYDLAGLADPNAPCPECGAAP